MSPIENFKTEIEELERKAKSTKRIYRRSILKAKVGIKRFAYLKVELQDKVENAIHGSIKRIHRFGFRPEEGLTRIYSMVDKPSYILKVKPSKISIAKYYLIRALGGIVNLLTRFKDFFANKFSTPPILYSKFYPLSMIELRFWYTGVYRKLTRRPKGFKDSFIRWKSSMGIYKVRIDHSKRMIKENIESSIMRGKSATRRFLD